MRKLVHDARDLESELSEKIVELKSPNSQYKRNLYWECKNDPILSIYLKYIHAYLDAEQYPYFLPNLLPVNKKEKCIEVITYIQQNSKTLEDAWQFLHAMLFNDNNQIWLCAMRCCPILLLRFKSMDLIELSAVLRFWSSRKPSSYQTAVDDVIADFKHILPSSHKWLEINLGFTDIF